MEQKQIKVRVPESLIGGVYSNSASITVRDDDVVVDFGFSLPGSDPATVQIGSRVVMTHASAERLMSAFQNALLDHRNKKKPQAPTA